MQSVSFIFTVINHHGRFVISHPANHVILQTFTILCALSTGKHRRGGREHGAFELVLQTYAGFTAGLLPCFHVAAKMIYADSGGESNKEYNNVPVSITSALVLYKEYRKYNV